MSTITAFDRTLQATHRWLRDLIALGEYRDEAQAYAALRAVLHVLRDRLGTDEAVQLAAEMPMLVRGFYFEGWDPQEHTPRYPRTSAAFIEDVRRRLRNPEIDPDLACRAVFGLLSRQITSGEIRDVRHVLPGEIRALWPGESGDAPPTGVFRTPDLPPR